MTTKTPPAEVKRRERPRKPVVPAVIKGLADIQAYFAQHAIPKTGQNLLEGWAYLKIEDVMKAVSAQLALHKIIILPNLASHDTGTIGTSRETMQRAAVTVDYVATSAIDGSSTVIRMPGEAFDYSDKATGKAMSASYKQALTIAFCIPIEDPATDQDLASPQPGNASPAASASPAKPAALKLKNIDGELPAGGTAVRPAMLNAFKAKMDSAGITEAQLTESTGATLATITTASFGPLNDWIEEVTP